jgi:hypothetical protein
MFGLVEGSANVIIAGIEGSLGGTGEAVVAVA